MRKSNLATTKIFIGIKDQSGYSRCPLLPYFDPTNYRHGHKILHIIIIGLLSQDQDSKIPCSPIKRSVHYWG